MGVQYVKRYQQGAIVKGGTVATHKCIRTESNKISTFDLHQTKIFESSSFSNGQHHCTSTFDLHQTKIFESSSFSNGQHHCTTLPRETEGNREPNVTEIKQRNLAVSLETPDQYYCKIPSKFFECRGRLEIAVSK